MQDDLVHTAMREKWVTGLIWKAIKKWEWLGKTTHKEKHRNV